PPGERVDSTRRGKDHECSSALSRPGCSAPCSCSEYRPQRRPTAATTTTDTGTATTGATAAATTAGTGTDGTGTTGVTTGPAGAGISSATGPGTTTRPGTTTTAPRTPAPPRAGHQRPALAAPRRRTLYRADLPSAEERSSV